MPKVRGGAPIHRAFPFLLLAVFLLFLTPRGTLALTPVEELAVPYLNDLVGWHLSRLPDLWWRQVRRLPPGGGMHEEEEMARLSQFFSLGAEVGRLREEVERVAALSPAERPRPLEAAEADLARATRERNSLAGSAEAALESVIGRTLAEEGAPWKLGPVRWPPVGFALESSPRLLVVSPRDRIERVEDVVLRAGTSVTEMEELEQRVEKERGQSALVVGTGGIAFYPAVVSPDFSLEWTLEAAAHEWMHHFLFFSPLGQRILASGDMFTLNETVANLAGREIGQRAYAELTGQPVPPPGPERPATVNEVPEGVFDFRREMRQTRLRVEELLGQGEIEEAEAYMEERRQEFVRQGYYIRKLNQAYFAFHGTYADSPASVSPIDGELRELRQLSGSLNQFLRLVAGVSSYQEFQIVLEEARQGGGR